MPENAHDIGDIVRSELRTLLDEEGSPHGAITPEDNLVDMGLDSLAFAVLITRLEDRLGYDPFLAIEQGAPPQRVSELIELYVRYGQHR